MATRTKWQTPLQDGDEQDAISGWRRVIKFRSGERSEAKRKYRRRVRAITKQRALQSDLEAWQMKDDT